MAVLGTTIWRVHPGKMQDFVGNVTSAKKIIERLGGRVRVMNQAVGSMAPAFVFAVETADWKAYGDLQAKMETDSEWQGFFNKAIANNPNPSADLIATGLMTDVPIG